MLAKPLTVHHYSMLWCCNVACCVTVFQLAGIVPIICEQLFVGIDIKKSSGKDIECQV